MQFVGFVCIRVGGGCPLFHSKNNNTFTLSRAFSYRCLCSSLGIWYSSMYCAFSHIGVYRLQIKWKIIFDELLLLLLLDLRGFAANMRSLSVSHFIASYCLSPYEFSKFNYYFFWVIKFPSFIAHFQCDSTHNTTRNIIQFTFFQSKIPIRNGGFRSTNEKWK